MRPSGGRGRLPGSPPAARPPAPPWLNFTDRVMARVAEEPRPSPARSFVTAMARLSLTDALAALRSAWRLAFRPSGYATSTVRARSLALLLSVGVFLGAGGLLLAPGTLGLFGSLRDGGQPAPAAPVLSPGPEPVPVRLAEPSPSPTPKPKPKATAKPRAKAKATATAKPRAKAARTPTPKARKTAEPRDDGEKERTDQEKPEPKERESSD